MRWPWKQRSVILTQPLLTEDELAGAFAVAESTTWFRAFLQVASEMEREASGAAQAAVANHGISASCNGGAEFIGRLRDRILELQQKGFGKLGSERKVA